MFSASELLILRDNMNNKYIDKKTLEHIQREAYEQGKMISKKYEKFNKLINFLFLIKESLEDVRKNELLKDSTLEDIVIITEYVKDSKKSAQKICGNLLEIEKKYGSRKDLYVLISLIKKFEEECYKIYQKLYKS